MSEITQLGVKAIRDGVAGGAFTAREVAEAFNANVAADYWPNQDPVGQRIRLGGVSDAHGDWRTVVGVVGSVDRQTRTSATREIEDPDIARHR